MEDAHAPERLIALLTQGPGYADRTISRERTKMRQVKVLDPILLLDRNRRPVLRSPEEHEFKPVEFEWSVVI